MISKVHVTLTAGLIALAAVVCATVAVVSGHDAAPYFALATGCVGVIGGVAVPTSPSSDG